MGGGGGTPQNIFSRRKGDEPREVFNWRLWFAVFSFGIMGAARGVDEGLISGTLDKSNFQKLLRLDELSETDYADVEGNIAAMVQIGSVGGAALAFILCDRIGRLWATRQLCLVWILGIVIFMSNQGRLGQVYAGRFIAGLGIGQTTVIAPVYLSEISPKSVRGLCSCFFSGSVYIGIMLAYFASWGSQLHIKEGSAAQWLVPTSIHLMFAGLILILSFFNRESPRYHVKRGNIEAARFNLHKLRHLPEDHFFLEMELKEIQRQLAEEEEATLGQGWKGYLKEIFLIPSNLYRISLGIGSQLLGQWSGAQSITIYAPQFFEMLGTKGQNEKLFATAIMGVVKFVAAVICALFLVDIIGRKRSLGIGITLQSIAMVYIASFLSAVPQIADGVEVTGSAKHASTGAIVMIYICGVGWAMGWNSIQYLLNAEIYPLRIRAVSSSMVMCFHFVNQYGNSRAVPHMLLPTSDGGVTPAGTFWIFSIISIIGGVWSWFFIPETAGRSLESMDRLFQLKWYQIGRMGQKDAESHDEQAQQELSDSVLKSRAQHEEDIGRNSVNMTEKV